METMATGVRSDSDDLLDYATVFDDEDFLELFLSSQHPKSGTQHSVPSHLTNVEAVEEAPSVLRSSSYDQNNSKPTAIAAPQQALNRSATASGDSHPPNSFAGGGSGGSCAAVPPEVPSSSSATNYNGGGLMSIVMLVDPVTDQVTLPQQQVIAGSGNEIVTIGPTVLSNFSKLDFSTLGSLGGLLMQQPPRTSHSQHEPAAAAEAPAESKFLPITPYSMQNGASSSSWNPQLLAAPALSASQPFALGSLFPFQSMSLGHHDVPQSAPHDASTSMMSLAPDSPPSSFTADGSNEAAAYHCVSDASSVDGGSLTSSGSSASANPNASSPLVPAPNASPAPLRALSAYNFFFRDERDRILHGGEIEWTKDKQELLLQNHWNQDRSKKRRHRKSHGKIDFSTLSKVISTRWKDLPEDRKDFFREVAARDWERFQRELAEYKHGASIDAAASATNGAAGGATNAFASFSFNTVIG